MKYILILIPILIILFGIIDFCKQHINPTNNNALKIFIKRLIIGASAFFITTIVSFIFNLLGQNINNNYFKCFTDPTLCNNIVENIRKNINNCDRIDNKNECCKFILNNKKALYNYDINDCSIPISTYIK